MSIGKTETFNVVRSHKFYCSIRLLCRLANLIQIAFLRHCWFRCNLNFSAAMHIHVICDRQFQGIGEASWVKLIFLSFSRSYISDHNVYLAVLCSRWNCFDFNNLFSHEQICYTTISTMIRSQYNEPLFPQFHFGHAGLFILCLL